MGKRIKIIEIGAVHLSNAWNYLKPKDKFSVKKNQYILEVDHFVLNMLYQPIIGVDAIGLLNLLLIEERINNQQNGQLHSVLLNQLNVGIPEFYQARKKLEALGLLKTYMKKLDYENYFIYEIQQPLSPVNFLHDDILSLLLIDKLGFEKVEQISIFFNYNQNEQDDFLDVTTSFMDVFHFDSNRLTSKQDELNEIKNVVTKRTNVKMDAVITETFDWSFFMSLIESLHIDKNQIKTDMKKTIELFHQLYGINELEMLDYIKQASDYATNQVNDNEFKQLIYNGYHRRRAQEKSSQIILDHTKKPLSETEKAQLKRNTLRLTGFSEQEIEVILTCEAVPPLVFLKALKLQKGGFVSNNERWSIENLKKQSRLPDSVINMLIHYVLVEQENSSLNQNLCATIANDWAQKKIFSPEDALKHVKEAKEKQSKSKGGNKRNYQKNTRKETLPDWAKDTTRRKETPLPDDEKRRLQNQLKQLNQKQKEGD